MNGLSESRDSALGKSGFMAGRHGSYPPELRERAVRLVAKCRSDHALWETKRSVASKLRMGTTETVGKWGRRAEVDAGRCTA
jgi:transposase